jgi:small subunit ribosomal protein S7
MQIRPDRKISYDEMVDFIKKKKRKSMAQRLASECLAAAKEEGAAVKKRMDTHKMAEA